MCVNNFHLNIKPTGTHYNINRDYNPITGRYIQSDPIGLDGGFSTFAYVNGNPVMVVDLEGLFGSQNKPDPVFIDRKNLYNYEINLLWNDIKKNDSVAWDIKVLKPFFFYNSAYQGYINGLAKRAITIRSLRKITFYRSTWEEGNDLRFNHKGKFIESMFHELQHLRNSNNYHPNDKVTAVFQDAVTKQVANFLDGADVNGYWFK